VDTCGYDLFSLIKSSRKQIVKYALFIVVWPHNLGKLMMSSVAEPVPIIGTISMCAGWKCG